MWADPAARPGLNAWSDGSLNDCQHSDSILAGMLVCRMTKYCGTTVRECVKRRFRAQSETRPNLCYNAFGTFVSIFGDAISS